MKEKDGRYAEDGCGKTIIGEETAELVDEGGDAGEEGKSIFKELIGEIFSEGEINLDLLGDKKKIDAILEKSKGFISEKAMQDVMKAVDDSLAEFMMIAMLANNPERKKEVPGKIKEAVDKIYESVVGEYRPYIHTLLGLIAGKVTGEAGGVIGSIVAGIAEGNRESFMPFIVALLNNENALRKSQGYVDAINEQAELRAERRRTIYATYVDQGFTEEQAMTLLLRDVATDESQGMHMMMNRFSDAANAMYPDKIASALKHISVKDKYEAVSFWESRFGK